MISIILYLFIYNIMATLNNISQEFYNQFNDLGTNPFVLVVLIAIIIIYYILFAFLGNNDDDEGSSGGFIIIEALLWGLFIILIFVNGLSYFFNINVATEFQNIFSKKPNIEISTVNNITKDLDTDFKEVYHVPGNRFTYNDAKAVCKAFDGEMADLNQLSKAQKKGASWCSYGWSKDQLALYPTSQSDFNKLQSKEGHEYDCGIPGINGGYVANTYRQLGANCYGVKPSQTSLELEYESDDLYPKTLREVLFDNRVDYWKKRMGNILLLPFNNSNWFKVPAVVKENITTTDVDSINEVDIEYTVDNNPNDSDTINNPEPFSIN